MAKQRRAKRQTRRNDDTPSAAERAVETVRDVAAASGAQAVRLATAFARGMARGMAEAAREMREPVGDVADAATDTARALGDPATRGARTRRTSSRRAG